MGISLGDVFVFIRGDKSGLKKDLHESEKDTHSWASRLGGTVNKLIGGAILGGATLAAGAVVGIGAAAFHASSQISQATNLLQTQLGLSEERAAEFGKMIKTVYGDNFGESIEDVQAAMVATQQELGRVADVSDEALTQATKDAIGLRDAFGYGVNETTNAAAALMDKFGMSSQEAMDFVTHGLQDANIANEDFLDTIGEYSGQFSDAGFDGGQFYSILATGSEAGVLGTDKVADAIKEMQIKLTEGGDDVSGAFDAIGMDFERVSSFVASGDESWSDYFDQIVGGLASIQDPQQRAIAQTAIFGTMAEDMGVSFTDSLSTSAVAMQDMIGSTDSLGAQYNNLGDMVEGFKRRGMMALTPIGDVLLNLGNYVMPLVEKGFAWFENTLVPVIERGVEITQTFIDTFIGGLEAGQDPLEAFKSALATFLPPATVDKIMEIADAVQIFIDKVVVFAREHAGEIKGALIAIGAVLAAAGIISGIMGVVTAITALMTPIGAVIAIAALLGAAWAGNWGGIQDAAQRAISIIMPMLEKMGTWISGTAIPTLKEWAAAFKEGFAPFVETIIPRLREFIEQIKPKLAEAGVALKAMWDKLSEALGRLAEKLGLGGDGSEKFAGKLGEWVGLLLEVGLDLVLNAIMLAIDGLTLSIGFITDAIGLWIAVFDTLWGAIDNIVGGVQDLGGAFESLTGIDLPDWLTPGSPTPFEMGLKGIGKAISSMPDLGAALAIPAAGANLRGALGGGGQSITDNRRSQNVTMYGAQFSGVQDAGGLLEQLQALA